MPLSRFRLAASVLKRPPLKRPGSMWIRPAGGALTAIWENAPTKEKI